MTDSDLGRRMAATMNQAMPLTDASYTPEQALAIGQMVADFKRGVLPQAGVMTRLEKILGPQHAKQLMGQMQREVEDTLDLRALLGDVPMPIHYVDPGDDPNLDDSDEVMICDTCKQSVNQMSTADGTVFVHARSFANHDHEVAPKAVPRGEHQNTQCDFCGTIGPLHWKYVGSRVRTQLEQRVDDFGTVWGACEPCSQMINDRDLERLMARALRVSPQLTSGLAKDEIAVMRQRLLDLWTNFLPTVHSTSYVGPQREPAKMNPRMMPKLQQGLARFWKHPNLLTLINKSMSEQGKTHSMPGVHAGDEEMFRFQFNAENLVPDNVWANHVNHLTAGIEGSDLYWISEAFTQLAIMSGKDFDKLVISREELPSKFGFMVFETPIFEIPRPMGVAGVRAITWTLVPGGIWVALYFQGEEGDPTVDVQEMRDAWGWLMCPNSGGGIRFDEEIDLTGDDASHSVSGFLRTIFATFFLITQPGVAESHPAPVDKGYVRSYKRAHNGKTPPDVQLVDLRRQPQRSVTTDGPSKTGRKLSERVYRKGHWKRQAYGPKWGQRKTIYVSPYIAGPTGAPLKARPTTVKVLR